jgi:hypothetical protein
MKGFITKSVALALVGNGLLGLTGCETYRELVDPCYPERYAFQARQSVQSILAAQTNNGHVLDQTVWNYHFESGTDKLTPAGQQHLTYLARRRPAPDPKVYLQTAHDVSYDPANPDKFANDRTDMDNKRILAVQRYLNAQTAGRPTTFDIAVHDPSPVGLAATPVGNTIQRHYGNFQGAMSPSAGVGTATGSAGTSTSAGSTGSTGNSGSSGTSR